MAKKKSKKQKQSKIKAPSKAHKITDYPWWMPVLLLSFAFVLYGNTIGHQWCLDDHSVIKDNYITKQGVSAWGTQLSTSYRKGYWNSKGTLYRPLSLMQFSLEWQLMPDNPLIHHSFNILYFGLLGMVLFLFLRRLLPQWSSWWSLMAVALFMAHPVHTEVVANIKSRDEIMASLGSLFALWCFLNYLREKQVKWLAGAAISFFLALLSKESAITTVGLMGLLILFKGQQKSGFAWRSGALAFGLPAILFLIIRSSVLGFAGGLKKAPVLDNFLAGAETTSTYLASALYMLLKYLKTALLPWPLYSDLGYNQIALSSFGQLMPWLAIGVLAGLGYVTWKGLKAKTMNNWSIAALGLLWFGITFSISSNLFVTIGTSYGERLLFLPILGLVLILVQLVASLVKSQRSVLMILGVVLIGYTVGTLARNPDWYNSYTLYKADISKSPNSAKLNYHYALEIGKIGQDEPNPARQQELYKETIERTTKAISIYPKYWEAYQTQGLYFFYLKDYPSAMKAYQKAIELNPGASKAYSNMAKIYFEQGQLDKAELNYEKAVKYDPTFVDGWRNVGALYAMTKRYDQALQAFQNGLKYDPQNATLLYYVGSVYIDQGKPQLGKPYIDKARQIDPSLPAK